MQHNGHAALMSQPLEKRVMSTNGNGNGEGIVEKIRKLLRLARDKGATEAEAATAMTMASKLMLQHNIDNVEEKVEEIAVRGEWHNVEIDKKWQQILMSAVAKLYNCRSVMMVNSSHVQFIGKPSNVLVAADTLQWVVEQVNALHKQALPAFKAEMAARNGSAKLSKFEYRDFRLTFKEACVLRIWRRVEEIKAAERNTIPSHMALIVIDQALAAADDLLREDGVKRSGKGLKLRRHGYGTGAGHAAGDQVRLQRTVK
jgi:hypothetical protein